MSTIARIQIEKLDTGIIGNSFLPYTRVTVEDVKAELRTLRDKYYELGNKISLLLNVDGLMEMDIEARKLCFTPEQGEYTQAVAIIAHHPISKMISYYTLSESGGNYPIQIFQNQDQGLKWLKTVA